MARKVPLPTPAPYTPPTVDEEVASRLKADDYRDRYVQVDQRLSAADTAGYDTTMLDHSMYADGDGNNVIHGDKSVQQMVEGSSPRLLGRNAPSGVTPYATKGEK